MKQVEGRDGEQRPPRYQCGGREGERLAQVPGQESQVIKLRGVPSHEGKQPGLPTGREMKARSRCSRRRVLGAGSTGAQLAVLEKEFLFGAAEGARGPSSCQPGTSFG